MTAQYLTLLHKPANRCCNRISRLPVLLVSTILLLCVCNSSALAQDPPAVVVGLNGNATYHVQKFDYVDMATGRLNLHIPLLVDHSQLGNLNFTYSLVYTSGGWNLVQQGQTFKWTVGSHGMSSVQFQWDGDLVIHNTSVYLDPGYVYFTTAWDGAGPAHPMGNLTSSQTSFRAIDGSGILITNDSSGNQMAVSNQGVQFGLTTSPIGTYIKDSNGNEMTIATSANVTTMTDTLKRPWVSTSQNPAVSTCPSGSNNSMTWQVPGYNGGTRTFTFCYSLISTSFTYSGYSGGGPSSSMLTAVILPNNTMWQFVYGDAYGDLTTVVLPTGGSITYTWNPMGFTQCGANMIPTVASRKEFDGTTTFPPSTYSFVESPGWTGTETDPFGNNTVYTGYRFHDGNCTDLIGTIQYYTGSSTLLKTVANTYQQLPDPYPADNPDSVPTDLGLLLTSTTTWAATNQVSETQQSYDTPGFSFTDTNYHINYTSLYGLVTSQITNDYGSGSPGAALSTKTTNYLALANSSYLSPANLLTLPSSITVSGATGWGTNGQAAQMTYGYDEAGSPQGSHGNQTSITKWLNTGTSPKTAFVYNSNGMRTTMTDPRQNSTTYSYDSTGAYVSEISYPNTGTAHNEFFTNDANTGLVKSYTDQNGNVTSYGYDSMERVTSIIFPATDSHGNTGGGSETYQYNDVPNPSFTVTRSITAGTNVVKTVKLDGLDRSIQTQLNSDPGGVDYQATTYDALDRVYTVSNPYRSTSDPTYGLTTYNYDALSRITSIGRPDGSAVSIQYSGNCVTVWDEAKNPHGECYDGAGRLTQLWEDQPVFNYPTYYTYDANDDLTSVNQSSLPRTFVYDSLSRMTSATNPELNTTNYAYDANGNAVTKTDARGITTTMMYDQLNRLTSKSYSDGSTPTVNLGYDSSDAWGRTLYNTVGRMVTAGTVNSSGQGNGEVFSYDPMGRVVRDEQCLYVGIGGCEVATAFYNYDSSQSSFTNVQGTTFSYSYNAAQQLTGVTSSLSGAGYPGTLISGFQYNALGKPTVDVLGSNVMNDSLAYTKRGWVYSYSTCQGTSSGCNAAQLDYTFNMQPSGGGLGYSPNGNVTYAGDWVNGNWTNTYDGVNRLSTASCAATTCPGNQSSLAYSFSYDAWGNRKTQTVTSGTGTSWSGNYTSNQITNSGYLYDLAGNLVNDGLNSYTYDGENRITSMTNGTATYTYDAMGRRVSKASSAGTVDYFYDTLGRQSVVLTGAGALVRAEIYSAGRHLGTYANGTTYFTLNDWLGTERVRTDVNGNVIEKCQNAPFGDLRSCSATDPSALHFTGQEWDTESGLDNFVARYYGSREGSFMSPDPLGGHLTDPQTLNKYSYVRNNPLSLTDPSGLDFLLRCNQTSDNASTCQRVGNSNGYTVQGQYVNGNFVATQLRNDPNGGSGFVDNNNNQYTGSFDQNGVHFTSSTGDTSDATFARGTNPTDVSGNGDIYGGFTAKFNDSCGGTCVASGSIFGTAQQFADLYGKLKSNPGLDALDLFHIGSTQFRGGNPSGVDAHIVDRSSTVAKGYDQFHYDGSYPYSTVPGFFDHAGSAFRSIGHLITGPRELPPPDQLP